MLGSDYCPYCGYEIEPDKVVEVCELDGDEEDELVECPNCGKYIRANFEVLLSMSLMSEEDYLKDLKNRKEGYEKTLKTEYGQSCKEFFEYMIEKVDEEIEAAKRNIAENKEIEDEDYKEKRIY